MDLSDSSLLLIQSLVGKEQFDLWFNPGGELEDFILDSESIWINEKKVHIESLNLLISDLQQGKVKLVNFKIK